MWLGDRETDGRSGPEREGPGGVEGRLDEGQSLLGKELDIIRLVGLTSIGKGDDECIPVARRS